jgi:hypothetical protein
MSFLSSTGGGGFSGDTWDATLTPGGSMFFSGPSLSQARSGLTITTNDSSFDEATYTNDTNLFNVVGDGIQEIEIPANGTYRVKVYGASGGYGATFNSTFAGLGAVLEGEFDFTEGQTLRVLVGQRGGGASNCGDYGGGGGGTFVTTINDDPIICAGGGNGGNSGFLGLGGDASNGDGTAGDGGNSKGGDGAGFNENGPSTFSSTAPQAFVNGGLGGESSQTDGEPPHGGFGGGAATRCNGSGASGGYEGGSGEDAPDSTRSGAAARSKSFLRNDAVNTTRTDAQNVAQGEVEISYIP